MFYITKWTRQPKRLHEAHGSNTSKNTRGKEGGRRPADRELGEEIKQFAEGLTGNQGHGCIKTQRGLERQ